MFTKPSFLTEIKYAFGHKKRALRDFGFTSYRHFYEFHNRKINDFIGAVKRSSFRGRVIILPYRGNVYYPEGYCPVIIQVPKPRLKKVMEEVDKIRQVGIPIKYELLKWNECWFPRYVEQRTDWG